VLLLEVLQKVVRVLMAVQGGEGVEGEGVVAMFQGGGGGGCR